MTSAKETPEMVFERINRRRVGWAQANDSGQDRTQRPAQDLATPPPVRTVSAAIDADHGTTQANPDPLRLDEVLFGGPGAHPAGSDSDSFPRSATMRLILKHPALALGIGLPATALLLRSHASRRLLGLALRVGSQPELHNLIGLSSAGLKKSPVRGQIREETSEGSPF